VDQILGTATRPDLSPAAIVLGLALAFALAFLWATIYRKTHSGVAYTRGFYASLILLAPIVGMIMMTIQSNVALSLGLVGALSIIRFRTAIKDTRDMTFLLMSVAIGLCAGAGAWMIAVIGTVGVSLIVVMLSSVGYNTVGSSDYILIFRSHETDPWSKLPAEAQSMVAWKQLRGATEIVHGQDYEYTYSIRLTSKAVPEQIVGTISNGVAREVTLITPENHLEL
jgi:uncharacterized membrane protein YhiD involved in acid resistance